MSVTTASEILICPLKFVNLCNKACNYETKPSHSFPKWPVRVLGGGIGPCQHKNKNKNKSE